MVIKTGLALCCFIIHIHAQHFLRSSYPGNQNADSIVFPDALHPGSQNSQTNEGYSQFGRPSTADNRADIERNNELAVTNVNGPVTQLFPLDNGPTGQASVVRPAVVVRPTPNPPGYNSNLFSVTNIGVRLLQKISNGQSNNVVLSPYSIGSLLALLQQGAAGQTGQELFNVLGMTPGDSAAAYYKLSNDYKNRNSRNILRTANNVYVGETFTINPDFKKIARSQFDSDITSVSFGRPAAAARQINNWVASKTNNEIENLVSPDSIDGTTQLVLVNAVYFKGLWDIPFNPRASYDGKFHLGDGQTKPTQFMRMKRQINYGMDSTTNAQIIRLPFEGDQYTMMVILPSKLEGVSRTIASLTSDRLLSYFSFGPVETQVEIPKFTIRADTDLQVVLKSMGLSRIFSPNAELDGLGRYQTSSPQISSAVHSAMLSIDENGAKAAAATSFAAVALSYEEPAQIFRADRPFIVILWDTVTSLPLFMAKVEDPEQ